MPTCESFPRSPEDCDTVNIVRRVFGALSILGCLFVLFVVWLYKRYNVFAQRLILFLTIAALFNGLGRLFQESSQENGGWCVFQAFWLNYFNYALMLWVLVITFNLFMNVVREVENTVSFERIYHVVCWGLSLAISLLPFAGERYGPSGSWCWIVNDVGWQLGIWYVPLFTVIFVLIAVYGYIIFTLYRKAGNWAGTFNPQTRQEQNLLKEEMKSLRFYPFVFLLLSVFPLINRIHNAAADGDHELALVLLHTMSASVQGAAYALVFTIDRDTLRSLTYNKIKAAILSKWATPAVVQEYPLAMVSVTRGNEDDGEEARLDTENRNEARSNAENTGEEARLKAENTGEEARLKAENTGEEARLKAENTGEEARLKAENTGAARREADISGKEARLDAEKRVEARLDAEKRDEARFDAENRDEARLDAEKRDKARLDAEKRDEARLDAGNRDEARLDAENRDEARLDAEKRNEARLDVENRDDARLDAENRDEARLDAENRDEARLDAETRDEARLDAENRDEARLDAEKRDRARLDAEN